MECRSHANANFEFVKLSHGLGAAAGAAVAAKHRGIKPTQGEPGANGTCSGGGQYYFYVLTFLKLSNYYICILYNSY